MSSRARSKASRANGAKSRGPVTAEGRARSSQNSIRHGIRADPNRVLLQLGESREEQEAMQKGWIESLRPRDAAEGDLVSDIVNSRWLLRRAERAHIDFVNNRISLAGEREETRVAQLMNRLFYDRRGPTAMYGLSSCVDGLPGTSWQDSPNDPNDPAELVRQLEGSAKGCQALIANWKTIAARGTNEAPLQAVDRFMAIRMLGRQPADAGRDERVNLIFVTSLALSPIGRKHAYEDLKSDMGTLELKEFAETIRSRGPLVIDAQDTAQARRAFDELIERTVLRLEARLELHQQLAAENPRSSSPADGPTQEEKQELEQLRRYELACQRRVHRCEDAFWKHRKEVRKSAEEEAEWAEEDEANCEGESIADLSPTSEGVEEAGKGPNENLTNEPKVARGASEVTALKRLADFKKQLDLARNAIRGVRDGGIEPLAMQSVAGGTGRAAIEESIFGRGPLMRPIT